MTAFLLVLVPLVVVHEALLARLGPVGVGAAIYFQAMAAAQSVVLAGGVSLAAAYVGRFRPLVVGAGCTLAPLLYLDAALHARIGRHIPAVVGLLLGSSLDENRRVLDAGGVGGGVVLAFLVGLFVVACLGAAVAVASGRARSRRFPALRPSHLVGATLGAGALLAVLEGGAGHAVAATSWARFSREVPQLLGALGPTQGARASFRAARLPLPSPASTTDAVARLDVPATPAPGDVFFFVVESLRADALDPATMPAVGRLGRDAMRPAVTVSGGNVTEYGWFSLFASRPALYWEPDSPAYAEGSPALRVARRRGWRIEVLWSGDPKYMRIDETMLGRDRRLADDVFVVGHGTEAGAADDAVVRELAARVARPHPPTVFVVSLESTHLPYDWAPGFAPPFAPYAPASHFMTAQTTPDERAAVFARYRDAVAYVDSLLGRFADGLRAAGSYDDATVVVVGDHGEEFWEHGVSSHSAEACAIQTHVALVMKPSRALRAAGDWSAPRPFARTIDVWPTILDAAGVRGEWASVFGGVSLLRGTPAAAITGTQRYRAGPARFVLDDGERRAVLELADPDHPEVEQRVDLLATLDEADQPEGDAARTPAAYLSALRERFGDALGQAFRVKW